MARNFPGMVKKKLKKFTIQGNILLYPGKRPAVSELILEPMITISETLSIR
jgi:hypothetical protein